MIMRVRNMPEPQVGITPMQEQVLTYLTQWIEKQGSSPTMQEIADGLSRSRRSVEKSIEGLERRGRVTRERGLARSLAVV